MTDARGTETSTTTIMFTDLVGSTELLDRLGDDAGHALHQRHLALLRRATSDFGGREVKALGDGLMVAFSSATAAVRCAIAMQEAVTGEGTQLRVGIDAGEPISLDDDLFGTPVVVAKRLCDIAKGGQILVTDLVCRLVGRRLAARFAPLGAVSVKGLSEPFEAVAIEWRESPVGEPAGGRPGGTAPLPRRRALLAGALVVAVAAGAAVVALTAGGRSRPLSAPARSDGSVQVFRPTSAASSAEHPCYSPSGSQLVVTLFTNGYNNPFQTGSAILLTIPAAGGRAREIVYREGNAAVNLAGRCYNAAAGRIAYSSDVNTTDNIWTSLPSSLNNSQHQVTCYGAPTLHAGEPTWSPDGRRLAYALVSDRAPGRATIWTISATNDCAHPQAPTRIVPGPAGCLRLAPADNHEPNWSPDGKQIVFQRQQMLPDGPINLWRVRPDGCALTPITDDAAQDTDPSWSPDSREIVYSTDFSAPTGVPNLFAVPATGGTPVRLTGQCYYDGAPSWSPNGKWVSFETWPGANPSGGDVPTAIWRIAAGARPPAPSC